jgi:hypothetical protein
MTTLADVRKDVDRRSTYLLVSLLFPLRDQQRICVAILQQPVVQLLVNRLFLVVELVYIATPLMRYLKDWPLRLVLGLVVCRCVLRVLHLVAENEQVIFDVAEAFWRRLPLGGMAYGRHDASDDLRHELSDHGGAALDGKCEAGERRRLCSKIAGEDVERNGLGNLRECTVHQIMPMTLQRGLGASRAKLPAWLAWIKPLARCRPQAQSVALPFLVSRWTAKSDTMAITPTQFARKTGQCTFLSSWGIERILTMHSRKLGGCQAERSGRISRMGSSSECLLI